MGRSRGCVVKLNYFPCPPAAPAPLAAVPAEDAVLVLDAGAAVAEEGDDAGDDAAAIEPE